jgi:hypothetical protein
MKRVFVIILLLTLCFGSMLFVVAGSATAEETAKVDAVTAASPNYYRVFTESELKSMLQVGGHYTFAKNSSPWNYFEQDWSGVSLSDLLEQVVGLGEGSIGVEIYAKDNYVVTLTLDQMRNNSNPRGLPTILGYLKGTASANNPHAPDATGAPWVAPLPANQVITAVDEGPFRLIVPQKTEGPDPRCTTLPPYNIVNGYNPPGNGDPNYQLANKWIRAIKVLPLPTGVPPIDATTVPTDQIIVYGNIHPLAMESILPASGTTGTTVNATITGTGFRNGASVALAMSGQTNIAAGNVVVVSDTQITCSLDLTAAATGAWDVVVTNSDTQSSKLAGGFTVNAVVYPPPTVGTIAPPSGTTGTTVNATITGTGFRNGASVALAMSGQANIAAGSVVVASDTQITCSLDLTAAATGAWDVVVTNSDTKSGTLPGGFNVTEVVNPAPTVTSVTPSEGSQISFWTDITIEGTGFVSGASVTLEKDPIVGDATNVTVVSDTQITCTVFLFGSEPGLYDVVVKNPDGQKGSLPVSFHVTDMCGQGAGAGVLAFGMLMGLLSLAGTGFGARKLRRKRK